MGSVKTENCPLLRVQVIWETVTVKLNVSLFRVPVTTGTATVLIPLLRGAQNQQQKIRWWASSGLRIRLFLQNIRYMQRILKTASFNVICSSPLKVRTQTSRGKINWCFFKPAFLSQCDYLVQRNNNKNNDNNDNNNNNNDNDDNNNNIQTWSGCDYFVFTGDSGGYENCHLLYGDFTFQVCQLRKRNLYGKV